ncbi:MAG: molybdopterin-dependent oxidoreductase [Gemmatimonadales bacterium]|nr:molybdopterin-dependent oxidoreductase [Gemmatimonadales bacterium]
MARSPDSRGRSPWLSLLVVVTMASPVAAQQIVIAGDVPEPRTVGPAELAKLHRYEVSASDHGRPPVTYSGFALGDVLGLAGLTLGESLRGPRLASVVLVEAADGYRVAFALAELDGGLGDRMVLVVDRAGGQPLDAKAGPLRLVVPSERRGARWIRQVQKIWVLQVRPPT